MRDGVTAGTGAGTGVLAGGGVLADMSWKVRSGCWAGALHGMRHAQVHIAERLKAEALLP